MIIYTKLYCQVKKQLKEMKNKKKLASQTNSKHESKYDKQQVVTMLKKSPVKYKTNQNKPQTQSSLQSSNFNFHPFKQSTILYGKKYHYSQINQKKVGDSNQSSTHCSFNNRSGKEKSFQNKKNQKSKSLKGTKNQQFCHQQVQEDDQVEIRLNSKQVMELINSYAIKIQRQWRRYWFRKCLRFIILKERQRKQFQLLNEYYGSSLQNKPNTRISHDFQSKISTAFKQQKIQQKRHTLPKLTNSKRKVVDQIQDSQDEDKSMVRKQLSSHQNQITQEFFNHKKYQSLSSIASGKLISNLDLSGKQKQSHQRTSSLGEKVQSAINSQLRSVKMVQVGFNCPSNQFIQPNQSLSTPVNELKFTTQNTQKKSSDKKSNIKLQTKVYQCQVLQENQKPSNQINVNLIKPTEQSSSKNLIQEFRKSQKRSPNIKSSQSISSKYDTKFPSVQNLDKDPFGVTKIFKKYKKAIQKQGNKKISKIQKHFEQKQITQRTYKNLVKETKDKLTNEMKTLQLKEGHFANSWKQVYVMFKDYVKENSFQQAENVRNQSPDMNEVDEHSISFDKWDFESSAKKSISHLQSFQDFARQLNERNPDKLKGFFIENKKLSSEHKTIELVLDELDRMQNCYNEENKEKSEFNDQEGSIYEQFKQRQRSNSFQKKNEHILVENISERLSYAQMKSPHVSPDLSPKQVQRHLKKHTKFSPREQVSIEQNRKFYQAKRQTFEFPQISTPKKSLEEISSRQPINEVKSAKINNQTEHIKTDESEDDSQVEMRVTSIKVEDKKISGKNQSQLYVPDNKLEKLSTSTLNQLENKKKLQKLQQNKKIKEKIDRSIFFIQDLGQQYFVKRIIPRRSPIINQISKILREVHRQRQKRKQLQQIQLRKYPTTIDPTIDAINTWLLQISHHLLDHHNSEIKKSLVNVKQIPKQEMLEICHSQAQSNVFYQTHSYITISQKVFKEFEFFYLKNVANNLEIEQKHEQNFQHLLYAFHRCLIDCMNQTLLDQLSIGRNWVMIPWVNSFRYRKNQMVEHSKQCLQRAINRVSGWGEYCLAQVTENNENNNMEWRQYQQERMNLVIRQQVIEYPLDNEFVLSNIMMKICNQIYQDQMVLAAYQIHSVFAHSR